MMETSYVLIKLLAKVVNTLSAPPEESELIRKAILCFFIILGILFRPGSNGVKATS
jgi:hypothetical protein